MKRNLKNITHWFKPILWFASLIVLVSLLAFASKSRYNSKCQEYINVKINYDNDIYFLSKDDILDLIRFDGMEPLRGKQLSEVQTDSIESLIESNPYVASANVFFDIMGNLSIDIEQKKPIVRVFNTDNVSYYLDVLQQKLPISGKFTARVPVVTNWNDNKVMPELIDDLLHIINTIRSSEFLSSFTEQVVMDNKKGFEIVPKIGDQIIVLGEAREIEEKLNHLRLFYQYKSVTRGWNRYKKIDLRFKNQIICTKR